MIFTKPFEPKPRYRAAVTVMNAMLVLTALGAVAVLLLDHGGFRLSPAQERWVEGMGLAVLVVFIADRLARCGMANRRRAYLREHWLDFALIGGVLVAFIAATEIRGSMLSAGALYVLIAQVYIVGALLLRGLHLNMRLAASGVPPVWMLLASFAALSLVGSGLLMLPAATPAPDDLLYKELSYLDGLFTSVSATCVTGLIVRDTGSEFTRFGQIVILAQIQLGGLGMMLFGTALAMAVGKRLTARSSAAVGEMLSVESVGHVRRTMWFVVLTTLLLEAAGAALLYPMFAGVQNGSAPAGGEAIFQSVFHSISSFCNAGFCLFGENMMAGVRQGWAEPFRQRWQVLGVMGPLIILGGLGFPVLQELTGWLWGRVRRLHARWRPTLGSVNRLGAKRLSLHAKLVLTSTAILLVGGAVGLLVFGKPGNTGRAIGSHPMRAEHTAEATDWKGLPPGARVREVAFQSITARTAGFNTIDVGELPQAGKLWMCGLMMVGGSPAGTAGGVKTVTLAVLVLAAVAALRRREDVEAFHRRIAVGMLQRAAAVGVLYAGLVASTTLLLSVAMSDSYALIDILFEATSACGTVGLSTGMTGGLTDFGKYVILGAMFIGRLGPLTLLLAMTARARSASYSYPAEGVVIG